MLLKEKRKRKKLKDSKKKRSAVANAALNGNKNEIERPIYKTCGRLYDGVYYTERSNLVSD